MSSIQFKWTEKYSVGLAELDEQHKHFIEICNRLIDMAESKELDREKALIQINELGDYAMYHLGEEERLFAEHEYPDAQEHITAHDEFRVKIDELVNKVRDEEKDVRLAVFDAVNYAVEWLLSHILQTDKKYTKFFNELGIN